MNRSCRLLIIEDEPSIVEFMATVLRRCGDQVDTAHSASQACRLLSHTEYDGVVADWSLGGETSGELVASVERLQPRLAGRILLISGDIQAEPLNGFARSRDLPLLNKPFTVAELTEAVRKMFPSSGQNSPSAA